MDLTGDQWNEIQLLLPQPLNQGTGRPPRVEAAASCHSRSISSWCSYGTPVPTEGARGVNGGGSVA